MLYAYTDVRTIRAKAKAWLDEHLPGPADPVHAPEGALQLATELKGLRFGEYVAENEADALQDYFVETAEFRGVVASRSTVFVGRKGCGKTANLLQAANELSADRRNLVCVINPAGYDLEAIVKILDRLGTGDLPEYVVEALWKYLLFSEIALSAVREAELLPPLALQGTPLQALVDYVRDEANDIVDDFAVRLVVGNRRGSISVWCRRRRGVSRTRRRNIAPGEDREA